MVDILDQIETVVILMMENRSFDHMLGYLSLPPKNRTDVDGLKADSLFAAKFANAGPDGKSWGISKLTDPAMPLEADPPHERPDIATQLGAPSGNPPQYPMNGFVRSCPTLHQNTGRPLVMGYYGADDLIATDFFAENFAICDHWFSSLPASTQPNRLMAFGGTAGIDANQDLLPDQPLVYDWLGQNNIRWRVYHEGLPFFSLMPKWWEQMLLDEDHFRSYNDFWTDIKHEPDSTFPQVIFIEPRFTNAPHIEPPSDDHAPSPIMNGQQFLLRVYNDLTANPERWQKSALFVMYDEHGGFFDHVSPPETHATMGGSYAPFLSTGVRVPAFVVSPFVEAKKVFSENVDHTCLLQLLAKKFGAGRPYSDAVNARRIGGKPVADISGVFTLDAPRGDVPFLERTPIGFSTQAMPADPTAIGLKRALDSMRLKHPKETARRFPELRPFLKS